jgi:nicotinamidase/pyrazinamidase
MKKLLIVVDYQRDFVDGALGFEKAIKLESIIYQKILEYKNNQDEVIFTLDTHDENYIETHEGRNLPVEHCILGTKGHALFGKIKELVDDSTKQIIKYTFPSIELANYLVGREYESIELCGVVSNICVLSNAVMVKSALPNTEIIVDNLGTASFDDDLHEKALDVLEGLYITVKNRGRK